MNPGAGLQSFGAVEIAQREEAPTYLEKLVKVVID
jgi:hypothetical protein